MIFIYHIVLYLTSLSGGDNGYLDIFMTKVVLTGLCGVIYNVEKTSVHHFCKLRHMDKPTKFLILDQLTNLSFFFRYAKQEKKTNYFKVFFLSNPVEFQCQPSLPSPVSHSVIPTKLASLTHFGVHIFIKIKESQNCRSV